MNQQKIMDGNIGEKPRLDISSKMMVTCWLHGSVNMKRCGVCNAKGCD
jgi:hypothetical protein